MVTLEQRKVKHLRHLIKHHLKVETKKNYSN